MSTQVEPLEHTVNPAAAATILSDLIAVLLPAASQAVVGQPASKPARTSTVTGDYSSRSSNSSLAATWVPLLLRLTAALEQAMRFEAQWGPSQPELEASNVFGRWGALFAKHFPFGAAWGATYVLLSTKSHAEVNCFDCFAADAPAGQESDRDSTTSSQHALLQWLLDNTPSEQLPAVQQRVLSMLCTAAKVCVSAGGPMQLVQVTDAYSCIFHTAWGVLGRLLPVQAAPTSSNAAAAPAGEGSSSSSTQVSGGTEQQVSAAGAAAPGQHNPAGSSSSRADACCAALSWMPLLGRCFLQASHEMASILKQFAPESASPNNPQQQE
jgi:hypothetical protein